MSRIEELREHYDTTDTAEELASALDRGDAVWETDTDADPLVGTSLRLPRSVLDRVRAEARARQMPTTALMRLWIAEGLTGRSTLTADKVGRELGELRVQVSALRGEIRKGTSRSGWVRRVNPRRYLPTTGATASNKKTAAKGKSGTAARKQSGKGQ